MALEWSEEERRALEEGLRRFPLDSGRCAALARVVYGVAVRRDPTGTRCWQVKPKDPDAKWVLLKKPKSKEWFSHTLVETRAHMVDAVVGLDGFPVEMYLTEHWEYPDGLQLIPVEAEEVDPGIQDQEQ